jgi:hypothetical protein
MKVKFESVIDGINRYIDREIYPGLNDLQEFTARLVVGRVNSNAAAIKEFLMNNGFVATFGLIDRDGMVDVDQLLTEVKREIERKGSIKIDVPMIGKLTFKPVDVDVLCDEIKRG